MKTAAKKTTTKRAAAKPRAKPAPATTKRAAAKDRPEKATPEQKFSQPASRLIF